MCPTNRTFAQDGAIRQMTQKKTQIQKTGRFRPVSSQRGDGFGQVRAGVGDAAGR